MGFPLPSLAASGITKAHSPFTAAGLRGIFTRLPSFVPAIKPETLTIVKCIRIIKICQLFPLPPKKIHSKESAALSLAAGRPA